LPMLAVRTPVTTSVPPEGTIRLPRGFDARRALATGAVITTSHVLTNIVYSRTPITENNRLLGVYYRVRGEDDMQVAGARPILPRTSFNVHLTGTVAHGALMLGGAFTDVTGVDPVVSRVLTDDVYSKPEPIYPGQSWYPSQFAAVNRFLGVDGQSRERLVLVPGQFRPTSQANNRTTGVQRLYTGLKFEVYHAPFSAQTNDFTPPSIWQIEAIRGKAALTFRALVEDDAGQVTRVVALYRSAGQTSWTPLELAQDSAAGYFTADIPPLPGQVYYFVQAVDATGNVALALDHGNAFTKITEQQSKVYLPLIVKQ
ncbi:MAG: hypothetical protein ACE5G8_00465, partial [Anaerolineae bacterium]